MLASFARCEKGIDSRRAANTGRRAGRAGHVRRSQDLFFESCRFEEILGKCGTLRDEAIQKGWHYPCAHKHSFLFLVFSPEYGRPCDNVAFHRYKCHNLFDLPPAKLVSLEMDNHVEGINDLPP